MDSNNQNVIAQCVNTPANMDSLLNSWWYYVQTANSAEKSKWRRRMDDMTTEERRLLRRMSLSEARTKYGD